MLEPLQRMQEERMSLQQKMEEGKQEKLPEQQIPGFSCSYSWS